MVGFVYTSGGNVTNYVNGEVSGTPAAPSTGSWSGSGTFIGRHMGGYGPTNGLIDEFNIWTRALNVDDMRNLYNGGAGRSLM